MSEEVWTALITGGAGGIGEATVRKLASRGIKILIADKNKEGGEKVAANAAKEFGTEVVFFEADVSTEAGAKAMVDKVVELWGRLDYAANIAGICKDVGDARFNEELVDAELFDEHFDTNVKGVWLSQKYEALQMKKQEPRQVVFNPPSTRPIRPQRGSIVNVASSVSHAAYGFPAYGNSKFAVHGVTKNGGKFYGPHGIRVNSISPGLTATPLAVWAHSHRSQEEIDAIVAAVPLNGGVWASPAEQANAMSFLLSPESSYINATNILVDGGEVDTSTSY